MQRNRMLGFSITHGTHLFADTPRNVDLMLLMWGVLTPVSTYELLLYYAN